jgi:hypothetical protein
VVEYLGRRIAMKRQQAGTLVLDGNSDGVSQSTRGRVGILALHQARQCRHPFARFEPRLQSPAPASGLVKRHCIVCANVDTAFFPVCLVTVQ